MRNVLGRGERERVVKKYMDEMGQQWKGAGVSLDYILGMGLAEDPGEVGRADIELAQWIWRNLFASRGLGVTGGGGTLPAGPVDASAKDSGFVEETNELELVGQVENVVRWVRMEMKRLEDTSDVDVLGGNIGQWTAVRDV